MSDKFITLNGLKTFWGHIKEALQNKFYTKEEINHKLKELSSAKVTDVYSKKEVDDKLDKKEDKLPEDFLDIIFINIEPLINKDHYQKDECNDLFQPKGDYALKSDIPKTQDLTPYAKKTDIYQENFIKLPDGTLIGIETKEG